MNEPLVSSTNLDTQVFPRHGSANRDLTLNVAPNIRPPIKVWVSSIDRTVVARSIIYSSTRRPMRIDSHSSLVAGLGSVFHRPLSNTRKRPAAQSLHQALWPRVRSSKPSFDATTAKLCVVDVFPQHNPAADQQLSCYCNGCYRFATSLANSFVKLLQLRFESHCHMSSFSQKEPQQSRAAFAYSEIAFPFGARSLHRLETNVSDHRSLPCESIEWLQGVNYPKSCQHANPRMSHQQLDSVVGRSLFLQPLVNLADPLVERNQQRYQVVRLVLDRWCHASIFQSLLPGPAEHPRSFRQTAADGNGLQVVTDHRPHLD